MLRSMMVRLALVSLVFGLISEIQGLADAAQTMTLAPESALWLVGDSTLHPFTSKTTQMQLSSALDTQEKDISDAVLRRQALKQFDLSIPVKGLKSKESALDKNMYKALKAEDCPSIDFHLARYEVGTATSTTAGSPVTATGALRIACQEQQVSLQGTLTDDQNALHLQGEYTLRMTDYGVKPPTMMMGTIKVKNPVVIHFDLILVDAAAAP